MKTIDITEFKRDLPRLLQVADHESIIESFNQIHESYLVLNSMVRPAIGATYQFQLEKAEKKIEMLQKSNLELIEQNDFLSRCLESKQFCETYPTR